MSASPRPSVATLFGEFADLPPAVRAERLGALAQDAPDLARELAALLAADASAGDFFGVLGAGSPAAVPPPPSPTPAPTPSPAPGAVVGPYRLIRQLGRGGMATVWLAHDERLGRSVALKFLRDDAGDDGRAASGAGAPSAGTRARFLAEARAAAALDHPHIAGVYDVGGGGDGRFYIAMPYCEGGSLADRLAAGPLAPADAARVAAQLASALGAAHARGVVHRDVKPANVLFDAAGAVRLADFGVAKLPGHDVTRPGLVVGTVAYMAPEQLRGDAAGPGADLWALGVTLYEMLAGRRPFGGDSHAAVMHAILHAPPEPLARAAPGAPPALAALAERLLAKDPAARPPSADAAARALHAAAADGGGPGSGDSTGEPAGGAARVMLGTPPDAAGDDPPPRARDAADAAGGAAGDSGGSPAAARAAAPRATPAPPPAPLTPFVGRARELAEVTRLLGAARLVTLTGAGGGGKTRLAREAAARAGAAAWVDLTAAAEPAQVAGQIAAALGVAERPGAAPLDLVRAALGGRPPLLVLDNCEHVVGAAAAAAEGLLRASPGLRVLATSREALGVPGEAVWPVPPLAPDEARRLFVERAQAAHPGFALAEADAPAVDEICRRLDGLPLAVELAAARARALTPRQIAARLDDAFRLLTSGSRTALPRQRTLRGTMDWSYTLLAPREQALLRRLAVFAGGFPLEAAEAVCGAVPDGRAPATLDAGDVLDGVAALVDRSLVAVDPGGPGARYRLLETVRQYAAERLREAGEEDAARAAHAAHFVAFAERAEPRLFAGAGDAAWIARVRADAANLRAAAAWAAEHPARAGSALRLGAAINWFWFAVGQYAEARARLTAALDAGAGADPLLRARALTALAFLAIWQGDTPAVRPPAEAAVALLRALPAGRADAWALAPALVAVSAGHVLAGDGRAAGRAADAAIAAARALPPHPLHSLLLFWRGWAALVRGEPGPARAAFEAAAENGRRTGHPPATAHPLAMLGRLAYAAGDHAAAAARYAESLAIHAATDDAWGMAVGLEGMARVAAAAGRRRRAARLLGAADTLRVRIASALSPAERSEHERLLAGLEAGLGAGFAAAWAEGRALAPADAVALADEVARATQADGAAAARATAPADAAANAPADAPANAPAAPRAPAAADPAPAAPARAGRLPRSQRRAR